jgi:glucose-6-phosphate isomerase
VYIITNLTNNRKYVGKKLAKFKKTLPPLKGKKRKRHKKIESDWRTYWGSNDELKSDVERLGSENFTREIIHFCPSRGVASYLEAAEQFSRKVLETDDYYNGIINVRIGGSKLLREALRDI